MDLTKVFAQVEVIDTINTGGEPLLLAYNPDNGDMYVADKNMGVFVIDSGDNTVETTINTGGQPFGVTYNGSVNLTICL